jgi:cysteine-S-conjugate beta-lyase
LIGLFDQSPFDDVSLELLRARHSAKWTTYPPDVLPAWVAETDFALAAPVR